MDFKTTKGIKTDIRIDGKIITLNNSTGNTTTIYKKALELNKRMEKAKENKEMKKEDIDFFLSLAKDLFGDDYELVSQLELQDFTKVLEIGVEEFINATKKTHEKFEVK